MQLQANLTKNPSLKNQVRVDAVQSEIEVLTPELEDYKALQQNPNVRISLESIEHLATDLIRARIAKGLTQAALAAKLGTKSQMIQRYETTDYASLSRVLEIARVIENTPRSWDGIAKEHVRDRKLRKPATSKSRNSR